MTPEKIELPSDQRDKILDQVRIRLNGLFDRNLARVKTMKGYEGCAKKGASSEELERGARHHCVNNALQIVAEFFNTLAEGIDSREDIKRLVTSPSGTHTRINEFVDTLAVSGIQTAVDILRKKGIADIRLPAAGKGEGVQR